MADEYAENLLRAAVAQLQLLSTLVAAREMFGKSYWSLGAGERVAVDQTAYAMAGMNYQDLTREAFPGPSKQEPIGFRPASDASSRT
jgi:hypothetical protein